MPDATFPSAACPCGAPQSDTERLFCDDCIEAMAADMLATERHERGDDDAR